MNNKQFRPEGEEPQEYRDAADKFWEPVILIFLAICVAAVIWFNVRTKNPPTETKAPTQTGALSMG